MERYYSYSRFLKEYFGEKVYKICVDGGFTCPNRDGTLAYGGCSFCSQGGSGEFCESRRLPIRDQLLAGRKQTGAKHSGSGYIAYYQAYTGTYGAPDHLRSLYEPAMEADHVLALAIGTRPDCLSEPVIRLLEEMNQRKPIFIEMGLQTCHDDTANRINRCYPTSVFTDAVLRLKEAGIRVTAHIILGLPGESKAMQLETVEYLNRLPVDGVKMSMLYVLKGTELGRLYAARPFPVFTPESYIDLLISCIQAFRPDMVLERITGDPPRDLLIAPRWGLGKGEVLNRIRHEMKVRDAWQGRSRNQDNSPERSSYEPAAKGTNI